MLAKSEIARLRGLARHRRDRREAGRFLVEGTKLVAEVLGSGLEVHQVIVDDDRGELTPDMVAALRERSVDATPANRPALERIASTSTPQPFVAEVAIPQEQWDGLDGGAVMVAVDLNDPGNVGTLARSAEAAGFAALVALGATADPWGPKAIRAAAGASFRLPVLELADPRAGLERLGELGYRRIGTRMGDATPCDQLDLGGATALVLGSEAHGLGTDVVSAIDAWTAIPMAGRVESLNVAMAGTILSYEVARQRRESSTATASDL